MDVNGMNATAVTPVRRRKILVVEDSEDTRKLILATLQLRDFEVVAVDNSDTALEQFQTYMPDLILLDVMMPGRLDGVGLCREIRALAAASVKIAFVSAKGQTADLATGRAVKADAYVVMPFSPIKLLETVDWLLV